MSGQAVIFVEMAAGAFLCFGFAARFAVRHQWSTSDIGRNLMAVALVLGVVFLLYVIQAIVGRLPLAVWTWSLAALDGVLAWRLLILFRRERPDRLLLTGRFRMSALIYNALRTMAQSLYGWAFAQLAVLGVVLPEGFGREWFVEVLVVGGSVALITAVLRWLETRPGDSLPARAARWLARILMIGLSGKQPVYAAPADAAPQTITYDNARTRPALR